MALDKNKKPTPKANTAHLHIKLTDEATKSINLVVDNLKEIERLLELNTKLLRKAFKHGIKIS